MIDDDVDDFLEHFGVKGMKWGQRKNATEGVSRKVDRDARKDAQEHARAKMFYGEGAGTRRKLIKAKVEQKSKTSAEYKKAFDNHSSAQDMGKHASKAASERKRKDVTAGGVKTAKGVHRELTGGFGNVSLASAVVAGAYVGAKKTGVDKVIVKAAKQGVKDVRKTMSDKDAMNAVQDWLKTQDFG